MTDTIIRCEQVAKQYYRYRRRTTSLRELFIHFARRRPIQNRTTRLSVNDVSLEISKGEAVALIGPNGSGKSTLLRLMAGIYAPTSGFIETWGHLTAVIELGAGFNIELTGTENIGLYGAIMGLSRQQIADRFPEIVEFASIGPYISEPVKYYSSGMQARLAFAVAVCAQPEILLIDEVLAVGDESFRAKCLNKIRQFLAQGGTLIVVSHDLDMIGTLCPRGIWLDDGQVQMDGAIDDVIAAYRASTS